MLSLLSIYIYLVIVLCRSFEALAVGSHDVSVLVIYGGVGVAVPIKMECFVFNFHAGCYSCVCFDVVVVTDATASPVVVLIYG